MKKILFIVLLVAISYTMGFYKVQANITMFGKQVDVWQADGFGNLVTWMRDTSAPYDIEYIKIKTKDGVEHRLRKLPR